MACSSCGKRTQIISPSEDKVPVKYNSIATTKPSTGVVVAKSTTNEKVKLRYYGGGMTRKASSGCSSCRAGKAGYSVTTTETIMFVSEDAPTGIFKLTVTVGHTYLVTRAQADYMLKLTYRDVAGKEQPKFKEVE